MVGADEVGNVVLNALVDNCVQETRQERGLYCHLGYRVSIEVMKGASYTLTLASACGVWACASVGPNGWISTPNGHGAATLPLRICPYCFTWCMPMMQPGRLKLQPVNGMSHAITCNTTYHLDTHTASSGQAIPGQARHVTNHSRIATLAH